LSFKHNVNRQAMVRPWEVLKELESPAWFGVNPQKLSDFQIVDYPGTVSKCWNHVCSRIASAMSSLETTRKPLSEFRGLIPIPKTFSRKQFIRIYETYKKYCSYVTTAIASKDEDALNRVIKATEMIGMGMSETDVALAWHIAHLGNKGIGAFPIHLGINQLIRLLGHPEINVPILKLVTNNPDPQLTLKGFENTYQKNIDICLRKLFAA